MEPRGSDEGVEAAELLDRPGDEPGCIGLVRHVRADRKVTAPLRECSLERSGVEVGEHDPSALVGEQAATGEPDPPTCPGDENDLAVEAARHTVTPGASCTTSTAFPSGSST